MRYRTPTPDDAEALLLQVAIGFDGYRALQPGWTPPDVITPDQVARCRRALADPAAFALIAEHGADPVGHVLWVPGRRDNRDDEPLVPGLAHLRQLFVLEPWWGTDVARTLHARGVAGMRERGFRRGRLFTPVVQMRARRFYEREGWRLVAEGPDPRFGADTAEYTLELP